MKPTPEQQEILESAKSGGASIKVVAYAGAGKTTTLKMLSETMRGKKGMYLAFNKAIADEANRKMPSNVTAKTFHSLAYRKFGVPIKDKLNMRMNGRVAAEMGGIHGIFAPDGQTRFPEGAAGQVLLNTIRSFCSSMDDEVGFNHVHFSGIKGIEMGDANKTLLKSAFVAPAKKLWDRMLNDPTCPATHDVYVKLWAQSNPTIPADFILFDEAQDADPLMMEVVNSQDAQVIWVGDPYQQIYGWRGAQNAMRQIAGKEHYLTQSFRFGPKIAAQASDILSAFLGESRPVQGLSNVDDQIVKINNPDAVLCRTNGTVFEVLTESIEQGKRVTSDGIPQIKRTLEQLRALKETGRGIGEFALFKSWGELLDYADTPEGGDVKKFVKLIDKHESFDDIYKILDSAQKNKEGTMITTAHRSKGLEYQRVTLAGDFRLLRESEEGELQLNPNTEEFNLLYVAATRAQKQLDMSELRATLKEAYGIAEYKHPRIKEEIKSPKADMSKIEQKVVSETVPETDSPRQSFFG